VPDHPHTTLHGERDSSPAPHWTQMPHQAPQTQKANLGPHTQLYENSAPLNPPVPATSTALPPSPILKPPPQSIPTLARTSAGTAAPQAAPGAPPPSPRPRQSHAWGYRQTHPSPRDKQLAPRPPPGLPTGRRPSSAKPSHPPPTFNVAPMTSRPHLPSSLFFSHLRDPRASRPLVKYHSRHARSHGALSNGGAHDLLPLVTAA